MRAIGLEAIGKERWWLISPRKKFRNKSMVGAAEPSALVSGRVCLRPWSFKWHEGCVVLGKEPRT